MTAPDDRLVDAFANLASGGANRALVCRNGDLAGLLSITDVARMLQLRALEQGDALGGGVEIQPAPTGSVNRR